jgi:hypothetical protein
MAVSFCAAAAKVVSIAATSPSQPWSLASSSRPRRLAWISSSRGHLGRVNPEERAPDTSFTCPVFLSGPEFLPELREQRRRTLTLIEISSSKGQARMAEMNQQVLTNLDRMIAEIAKDEGSEAADAG